MYKKRTLLWTGREYPAGLLRSKEGCCHKESNSKHDGNAEGKHFEGCMLPEGSGECAFIAWGAFWEFFRLE